MKTLALALCLSLPAFAQGVTVSDGYQVFYGVKEFASPLIAPALLTTDVEPLLDGQALTLVGKRYADDTGSEPDVSIHTANFRLSYTKIFGIYNLSSLVAYVGATGTVYGGLSQYSPASFVDGSGSSGHTSLTVSDGMYTVIRGQLPEAYWGQHGAVSLSNGHPMSAGNLVEVTGIDPTRGESGGESSTKKLLINYQGGLTSLGAYSYSQLASCGLRTDHLDYDDGGASYRVATDAGVAQDSALMWVTDKRRWCYCDRTQGDGGDLTGWRRMSDNGACGP